MVPAIERLVLMVLLLAGLIWGIVDPPRAMPEEPSCPNCVPDPPG